MQHTRALRSSALREGQRCTREIHGRTVTFIRHRGTVHAVDAKCYHQGGPLGEGDIEELGAGNICIKCPWHGYRVNLDTGAKVDTDLCGNLCVSAPKQRVYKVIDDNEHLWILMDVADSRASDRYNVVQQLPQTLPYPSSSLANRGLGASFSPGGGIAGGLASRGLGSRPFASAADEGEEDEDIANSSQESAASTVPFLEPFGGLDKYYPPPSPVKPPPAAPLGMRGRKAKLRGEHAREAVKRNYRPPPSSLGGERQPQRHAPGTQLKVTELFGRHFAAQQQWQPGKAADGAGVQDMDI